MSAWKIGLDGLSRGGINRRTREVRFFFLSRTNAPASVDLYHHNILYKPFISWELWLLIYDDYKEYI